MIIILPLLLIGAVIGGYFLIKSENKKMKKQTKTSENNQEQKGPSGLSQEIEEKKNPAFHLFLYLFSFLSLGFLVAGEIIIFFQAINKFISNKDEVSSPTASFFENDAVKFALSALLVATPIYFLVLFLIEKKLKKKEIMSTSVVRKFITYLALVIFLAMAIGSLISLLYTYFDGELTGKFLLKVLSFFVVSIFFSIFYFWEIRRKEFIKKYFLSFFTVSLVIAIGAIILGFVTMDNPRVTREKRIDQEMIKNLIDAKNRINAYYEKSEVLPKTKNSGIRMDKEIIYKPSGKSEYELCATFLQPAQERYNKVWNHKAGEECFTFDAIERYGNPIKMD